MKKGIKVQGSSFFSVMDGYLVIGCDEVQEIWNHYYYVDCRSDDPEQFRAIGWVQDKLYSVIYEDREDEYGEYYHLVTLWKTTRQEEELYEKNS